MAWRWLTAVLLAMASIAVYGRGFDAPLAAAEQELVDRRGDPGVVPLTTRYIQADDNLWLAPALVRGSAIAVAIGNNPTSPRFLSIAFGAADVALVYMLALQLFGRPSVATLSALILLFTPAHAAFSRSASVEGIWPVPFVLLWAVALTCFVETRTALSRWYLAAGIAALMLAAALQPTAAILAVLLGGITLLAAHIAGRLTWHDVLPSAVTAAVFALPIVWWSSAPADGDSFARWMIWHADLRAPQVVSQVASRFWEFFQPSHLFLVPGERALAGLFLAGTSVPISLGMYALVRKTKKPASVLIVAAGCLAGPMTAALCGPPTVDARAISILPFGALVAAYGSAVWWRLALGRVAILLAGAAMAAQVWVWFR